MTGKGDIWDLLGPDGTQRVLVAVRAPWPWLERKLAATDSVSSLQGGVGRSSYESGSATGAWRFPNRFELESLLDMEFYIRLYRIAAGTAKWTHGNPFLGVDTGDYWSSTTNASGSLDAWFVRFSDGHANPNAKTMINGVWPVRGGQ